jgi:hypothetical protein
MADLQIAIGCTSLGLAHRKFSSASAKGSHCIEIGQPVQRYEFAFSCDRQSLDLETAIHQMPHDIKKAMLSRDCAARVR